MRIDFSKLDTASNVDTLVRPREIFASLPLKSAKYAYLRDVQAEVLEQWFGKRTSTDLRLKMNTGGGKTLVGLLMLKSSLNEGVGPAVYIAPTPYLAEQACAQARELGLSVDSEPRSAAVARGKSILVTHIHVLLNGKSKFGVGEQAIPIGSLVLDDAHACLATAEKQFTLSIGAQDAIYDELLELFRADLEEQSSASLLGIVEHDPTKFLRVPFWAWQDKLKRVEAILHKHRDEESLMFVWPLVGEYLRQCRCVVGGRQVEISPRCLPVDVIPSFVRAKRRIFMSATFADDAVLVTDFNVSADNVKTAIAPSTASDIGDRMILVPQELDPQILDESIRDLAAARARTCNVVVLVPSGRRATDFWGSVAADILTADTLDAGIARLRQGHVGLVVIVNKYDGIDLPDNACRLLILDGVPDARRTIDKIEQAQLLGTDLDIGKSIQVIEQGMGRGVRASDDYCVVLLMGRTLIGQLFNRGGVSQMTPATRAQFNLSEQVGEQVRNKGIAGIGSIVDVVLARNPDWVRAAKSALVHVQYATESADLSLAVARRAAFTASTNNDYSGAVDALQDQANAAKDPLIAGWLKAELAECLYPLNPVQAQELMKSAHAQNRQLTRPLVGINYRKLTPLATEQAAASLAYWRESYSNSNEAIIAVNAIVDDLSFREDSYKRFHRAMQDVAAVLGFGAQLPESEFGAGPDVLWAVGGLHYFVVECKNEASVKTVCKKDCNQLAGSVNWFHSHYDKTCTSTPVLVHPSTIFEHAATPPPGTRVVTVESLRGFGDAVTKYAVALGRMATAGDVHAVARLIGTYHLTYRGILERYTLPATAKR